MTAYPPLVREDSSTLREPWGVLAFVMAALLADTVFIMGEVVPRFAVNGKRFVEFVSGGSPNP